MGDGTPGSQTQHEDQQQASSSTHTPSIPRLDGFSAHPYTLRVFPYALVAVPLALGILIVFSRGIGRGLQVVLKVSVTLSLAGLVAIAVALDRHPLLATGVLIGLAFCAGGDYALAIRRTPRRFVVGLALFLAGYLVYGVFLLHHAAPGPSVVGVALVAGAVIPLQYRTLHRLPRELRLPVLAYMLVISFLIVSGAAVALQPEVSPVRRVLAVMGTASIYASDTLIGRHEFGRPLRSAGRWIMSTYYLGQLSVVGLLLLP